jgi:hypothetical protein
MDTLKGATRNKSLRVTAFYRDFNRSLDPILEALKPNSYMVWTVGSRRVGGQIVPIDKILTELFDTRGVKLITKIQRRIPVKRMASKNKTVETMGMEMALIFRKGAN